MRNQRRPRKGLIGELELDARIAIAHPRSEEAAPGGNEGIGGNRILTPTTYTPLTPFSGGPNALSRLDRDVFSLSSVAGVVWLEGINDFGGGSSANEIIGGIRQGVSMMRAHGLKIVQATITSALGNSTNTAFGVARDQGRKVVNAWIRSANIFDSVADMDAAADDPVTGMIKSQYLVNSTLGTIDHIHPNRAGYLAMAATIDLLLFAPAKNSDDAESR